MKTLSGTELCPLNGDRGDTTDEETGAKRASSPPPCLPLPDCGVKQDFFLVIKVINEQDFLGGRYSFRKQCCTDTFTANLRIQQCIKTHYFSWGLIAALNVEVLH